jgi:hypothetical protein
MAAMTTTVVSFAICSILGVDCSSHGAGANGGSWGGCVDNGGTCGVGLKCARWNTFFLRFPSSAFGHR